MPAITQAQALRRGLEAAAMLAAAPRQVSDLCAALGIEERDAQRMIAGLREAGIEIECEARFRERWYRITSVPAWLAKAISALAGGSWVDPRPMPARTTRRRRP